MIGDNIYVKNCEAGFYFVDLRNCDFTKIMIDNADIPIYGLRLHNCTFEIEQSTKFYIIEFLASYGDKLNIESSDSDYNISMSYIPKLGFPGYVFQLDNVITYHVSLYVEMLGGTLNFTIKSVPRYTRPGASNIIPGYPFFWLWSVMIIGLLIYIESFRRFHRR